MNPVLRELSTRRPRRIGILQVLIIRISHLSSSLAWWIAVDLEVDPLNNGSHGMEAGEVAIGAAQGSLIDSARGRKQAADLAGCHVLRQSFEDRVGTQSRLEEVKAIFINKGSGCAVGLARLVVRLA